MDSEFYYYKVTGGKILAAIQKILEEGVAQQKARLEFMDEFGAVEGMADSHAIVFLTFNDPAKAPEGWRRANSYSDQYRPDGRTKAGRAILKRMRELPLNGTSDLTKEITGHSFMYVKGTRLLGMRMETIGETYVLLVPKPPEREEGCPISKPWSPSDDGCTLLKDSEFWALKEEIQ